MAIISFNRTFQPVILAYVGGQSADDLIMQAGSFTVNETVKKQTKIQLTLSVLDPYVDFSRGVIDDPRCQPGAEWCFRWGYFDEMSEPLYATVTHFKPDFGADGATRLTLYFYSKGPITSTDTITKNWGRVNSSDIAIAIARRYNMAMWIEPSDDRRSTSYVQSAGMSDFAFLQDLASRINYVCYVDNNLLVYRPPDYERPPTMELAWFAGDPTSTLQSFKPDVKEAPSGKKRKQGASDASNGSQSGDSTTGPASQNSLGNNAATPLLGVSGTTGVVTPALLPPEQSMCSADPTPETDRRIQKRHADAAQRKMLDYINAGTAECLGSPRLRKDRVVRLTGIGTTLSGAWTIREATHKISDDGLYTTTLKLKRGAQNRRNPNANNTQVQGNNQDAQPPTAGPNAVNVTTGGVTPAETAEQRRGREAQEAQNAWNREEPLVSLPYSTIPE